MKNAIQPILGQKKYLMFFGVRLLFTPISLVFLCKTIFTGKAFRRLSYGALSGFFCLFSTLYAQDFTEIGKRKPFQMTGNILIQGGMSLEQAGMGQSSPFDYLISLQLNPSVYGISLPLSFSYAQSRFSYTQPFSRLSLSPSYKWIRLFLGRTQMNMHPYGLNSSSFDGVGVELRPDKIPFYFSAMYGAMVMPSLLSSERPDDTLSGKPSGEKIPFGKITFSRRRASAVSLGYSRDSDKALFHLLYVKDRVVQDGISDTGNEVLGADLLSSRPQANLLAGLDLNFKLWDQLYLTSQMAMSLYSSDILALKNSERSPFIEKAFGKVFPVNSSTSFSPAFNVSLRYRWLQMKYERIEPGYMSLGSAYMNQDFQHLVMSFAHNFRLFDVHVEMGWQQDDLRKINVSKTNRLVGAANIAYRNGEKLTIMASYSNFTTHTRMKPVDLTAPDDPWIYDPDTVSYRQISQQASFHTSSSWGKHLKHTASFDFSFQNSWLPGQASSTSYLYSSIRHGCRLENGLLLTSAINFSGNMQDMAMDDHGRNSFSIGPSFHVSHSFFGKALKLSGGTDCYTDIGSDENRNIVASLRTRVSYVLKENHHFGLQMQSRFRRALTKDHSGKNDFQVLISYQYRFGLDPYRKKKKTPLDKTGGVETVRDRETDDS